MSRPARARINLQALQHNFSLVQQAAPDSHIMAIIKANAYGHGMVRIAQALPAAAAFGVSCLDEAIALREAGFDRRIVLLEGLFGPDDIGLIGGYRLDVVVHHDSQLQWLTQERLLRPLDVWLKIDTGMHRLGFDPQRVSEITTRLQQIPQVASVRYMTHFPCADDLDNPDTREQIEVFKRAVAGIAGDSVMMPKGSDSTITEEQLASRIRSTAWVKETSGGTMTRGALITSRTRWR